MATHPVESAEPISTFTPYIYGRKESIAYAVHRLSNKSLLSPTDLSVEVRVEDISLVCEFRVTSHVCQFSQLFYDAVVVGLRICPD